jgi:ankyrin repeat protein
MRTSIFCLLFVLGTLTLSARAGDAPAGSGATVNTDSVPVYAETARSSVVLKHLAKGEAYRIDYSVMTAEGEWCSLGQPAHGYVLCAYLKREEPLKQDSTPAPLPAVLTPLANHPVQKHADRHAPQPPVESAMFTPEQSALMSAAKVGSITAIQLALAKGALVNGRDKDGKTALIWAAYMGRNEAMTELLSAGADANLADSIGWTALEAAVWARHPAALELLLAHGPEVNPRDSEGRTPLMHAAQYGDLVMIRDLLAKGADPNASNRFGQTPLMFAVALPDPDAAALLIAAGADVNARDAAGRSVLINAALTGADRTANVRLLIEARADLNAKDNDNRTALAWAIRKGQTSIALFLKKSGATEW